MIRKFFASLQFRVAVVFLLLSTVPLGIVGLFSVRTADRLIASIVSNQLENMATGKQDLLARWIAERKADLAVVAGSAALRSLEPARIGPYLDVQRNYGVYRRFVVCDGQGKTIYDTAPADGAVGPDRWWQAALQQGSWLSDVALEPGGKESVFRLAEPIRDPQGAPLGAVCATVSTSAIHESVLSVFLGQTGECYLVDSHGTFVADQDASRVLSENIAHSESFLRICRGDRSNRIYPDYRGIPVLGAWHPWPGPRGFWWWNRTATRPSGATTGWCGTSRLSWR
ncbi:MAG: cache domain-containing protein [Thermoguttaceae bacterium]